MHTESDTQSEALTPDDPIQNLGSEPRHIVGMAIHIIVDEDVEVLLRMLRVLHMSHLQLTIDNWQ
jgi:hypothetical protein